MFTLRKLCASSFLLLCLLSTVLAQGEQPGNAGQSVRQKAGQPSTTVTASATAERVRFTAPSNVVRMQLQIISESGQVLFDVSSKGNVLDWSLQDSGGQRLQGAYLTVVTVKSLSGRLSERIGSVSVAEKQVELEVVEATGLTPAQQQAVGPIEEHGALTIIKGDEGQAITVLANNGSDGQIIRDRGALSFRLGDFFSGNDKEQMRLTEEGNLGIGTTKPKARLDVAGMIRAREGFLFSNGSALNVNDRGALTLTNSDGNVTPNVGGNGTQNKLAKWKDNSGTLGDSILAEANAALQLSAPVSATVDTNILFLDSTSKTTGVLAGSVPAFQASNGPFFAMRGNNYTAIGGGSQRGLFAISAGDIPAATGRQGSILFNTGPDQVRMSIKPTGDVGIGTETPAARLDVAGDINTSTQYNIGGQRVLSVAGTENVFAGAGTGEINSGFSNSFFGHNAGYDNMSGGANSFFGNNAGHDNTNGIANSFFGYNAGRANISGQFNSFFGNEAGSFGNSGSANSFFGYFAGMQSTGTSNSFFGQGAGSNNTTGSGNVSIGGLSGPLGAVDNNNTFIGTRSNGTAGITNATAIGYQANVTQSDAVVIGSINGFNGATADTKVGIGTTAPVGRLQVVTANDTNPSVVAAWDSRHFVIGGAASSGGIGMSYDQTNNVGYIQALTPNQAFRNLVLQFGGNVGIGASSPTANLQVTAGDAAISTQGRGLILRATNGPNCYRLTVDNAGALTTALVACP